jgi:FdrA protein
MTTPTTTGPTTDHVELRPGAYADSVALLQVSRDVQRVDGVVTAQVAMATPLNVEVLDGLGFELPDGLTTNDLVVAVRLSPEGDLATALAAVDAALRPTRGPGPTGEVAPRRTTATALDDGPALVLVSVPGASAFVEAVDALDAGCDVMLFSDNVPVEQEVVLKRTATERGLLVMGPDCGTAVVGGLGLGFANATRPGPVGIVAASGTGCQQLLALLDHAGVGVGTALGVGGRDLSAEVGGLSTLEAMRRLDADDEVELLVVVSKPPAPAVAAEVEALAATLSTPVELALLGAGRPDLTAAAEAVLRRLGRDVPAWPVSGRAEPAGGGVVRGLLVGGTLAQESRLVVEGLAGADAGHTFTDFGDDDYTQGRAHPMIDPTLRLEELHRAATDPATGALLLDVVLGHGAEPDPAAALAQALAGVRLPVVVSVVGTADDPQNRERQVAALVAAGAEVHLSHATATRRALELAGGTR